MTVEELRFNILMAVFGTCSSVNEAVTITEKLVSYVLNGPQLKVKDKDTD